MTRDRKGFTMIELLVVTVLGGLVLMAALQILVTNQRTYTAQNAVISGQQSARMGLELLFNELRELSPEGGDILAMSSTGLRVRLMRKFSRVCEVDVSGANPELLVLNLPGRRFEGVGTPYASSTPDSVFVFAENDPYDDDDDVWIRAQVTAVDTAETCPQGGEAASQLTFGAQMATFITDSVDVGAPVRSFETFTFGPTWFLGDRYLARNGMPVVGPLSQTNPLEFVYRDALGNVTSTPSDVRQIVVKIRTGGEVMNSLNQEVRDSITAWIYTRN